MSRRKTAGELTLQCRKDTDRYDPLEVGYALREGIEQNLQQVIERHDKIFDEEEYCIGYVLASDPLLKNIMRRKFFAMLYLPSPRPNQAVFLYNKKLGYITKRLWVLPNAATMAQLSETHIPPKGYETMKAWSDAFFDGIFWQFIRAQHDIKMLSEHEYLNANREKLVKAGCKEVEPGFTEPFDFSKIQINHIVDTATALAD